MISLEQYNAFCEAGYRKIPVVRRLLADTETPLSVYAKLANNDNSYLFESVEANEKWGRYSFIGLQVRKSFRVFGQQILINEEDMPPQQFDHPDPLTYIQTLIAEFSVPELPDLPRFTGGLVGYFSYDTVRYVEPKLRVSEPADELGVPDILLLQSDDLIIFDNFSSHLYLITHIDAATPNGYEVAQDYLDHIQRQLNQACPDLGQVNMDAPPWDESLIRSGLGQDRHGQAVERIKDYCEAGDVMQVVMSQRLTAPFSAPPIALYRALRSVNPSPYMYFLNLGDFQIVGASPEIMARSDHGEVTVRPIAGTRRRGHTEEEDRALEQDMLSDPKEIAEHLMLIDLGRNDAGRIAKTGTVKVTEQMVVERYSHVMHITSNVIGRIKEGLDAIDVVRAVHPAGTLSGAPKIRAMQIIDELEPVKRGVYGGAVGWIGFNGDMDLAIAIRTAVIKDQQLVVQSGGGVVADSLPKLEWKETMNKARAMFRAASMVQSQPGDASTPDVTQQSDLPQRSPS